MLASGVVVVMVWDPQLLHEVVASTEVIVGPVWRVLPEVPVSEQCDPWRLTKRVTFRPQEVGDSKLSEVLRVRPEVGHFPLIWLLFHDRRIKCGGSVEQVRISQQQLQGG